MKPEQPNNKQIEANGRFEDNASAMNGVEPTKPVVAETNLNASRVEEVVAVASADASVNDGMTSEGPAKDLMPDGVRSVVDGMVSIGKKVLNFARSEAWNYLVIAMTGDKNRSQSPSTA